MTRQEMFDKSVAGLASQGFERCIQSDSSGDETCLYRSGNRRCAYGWLLSDAKLDQLEREHLLSASVTDLFTKSSNDLIGGPSDLRFICDLQYAHDSASDPYGVIESLCRMAEEYGLTMPVELHGSY